MLKKRDVYTMFNIVLYQPEIPPNTGNIMRLCANSGCRLHLIHPLGFSLDDKHLKRANLDYEMLNATKMYKSFNEFRDSHTQGTTYLCTTKGEVSYSSVLYNPNDNFIFGSETRGLPQEIMDQFPASQKITIPMRKGARSLNLSNAVAIIMYEAWRQQNFI